VLGAERRMPINLNSNDTFEQDDQNNMEGGGILAEPVSLIQQRQLEPMPTEPQYQQQLMAINPGGSRTNEQPRQDVIVTSAQTKRPRGRPPGVRGGKTTATPRQQSKGTESGTVQRPRQNYGRSGGSVNTASLSKTMYTVAYHFQSSYYALKAESNPPKVRSIV